MFPRALDLSLFIPITEGGRKLISKNYPISENPMGANQVLLYTNALDSKALTQENQNH